MSLDLANISRYRKTKSKNIFDILVNIKGGGIVSQVDAIRHGISKALLKYDEGFHLVLKQSGFLTRDSRKKERKTRQASRDRCVRKNMADTWRC